MAPIASSVPGGYCCSRRYVFIHQHVCVGVCVCVLGMGEQHVCVCVLGEGGGCIGRGHVFMEAILIEDISLKGCGNISLFIVVNKSFFCFINVIFFRII